MLLQVSENAEIQNIKQILGLQHGKAYDDVKALRYGHLMIMTDQVGVEWGWAACGSSSRGFLGSEGAEAHKVLRYEHNNVMTDQVGPRVKGRLCGVGITTTNPHWHITFATTYTRRCH
jgi:hypothetical protein